MARKTLEQRFWAKVDPSSDCWVWTGVRDSHGYGSIKVDGVHRPAHRVAYEMLIGPISSDLCLDHLCRNRACVNPSHLEAVTNAENIMRGYGQSARNARKTHCKRGHLLAGENLQLVNNGTPRLGRRCLTCYREYRRNRQRVMTE